MKNKLHFFTLAVCVVMLMGLISLPVSAVDETAEHANALHELGLFAGTESGFELDRQPTRVEGLVMFIRLLGVEEEALYEDYPHKFSDVPNWASAYVGYAYYHGLTTGVSQTTFGTFSKMTAGEYLTLLLRALGYDDSAGDFTWNTSIDKAEEIRFLSSEGADAVRGQTATRGTMVDLSWTALTQPFKEDHTTTLAQDLVSKGVFTQQQAIQFDIWEGTPKPYLAKTLFRATVATHTISTNDDRGNRYCAQMVQDGEGNLIYYDEGARAICRRLFQNGEVGEPEVLLDVKNATYTAAQADGVYITYHNLKIEQIFQDDFHHRLFITGTFQSDNDSVGDGWSSSSAPSSYTGTFIVEHGALTHFCEGAPYFHCVSKDGRYVVTDFRYAELVTILSGVPYLWDPDADSKTDLRERITSLDSIASIGTDLFECRRGGLSKYNFGTGHFEDIPITLSGFNAETSFTCQNDLFYYWNPKMVCAVRPNGQQKILMDPREDIEVTDMTPMPRVLDSFLVTPDETFIFYDASAKAIRIVYENPELKA